MCGCVGICLAYCATVGGGCTLHCMVSLSSWPVRKIEIVLTPHLVGMVKSCPEATAVYSKTTMNRRDRAVMVVGEENGEMASSK